ncbi:MAG: hypothetical protein M1821_007706 [Bathelium mastoideum]|nr:MAG: hypothetical protein M1821_007706 [Bathelium mastoideum]
MVDLPSPPFVTVDGVHNFRDVGGTPVALSSKVVPGILFRSADPSNATSAGLRRLRELGITHVFDLRSTIEIERDAWNAGKNVDPEAGPEAAKRMGIDRSWTPVFSGEDYSPENIALRYRQYARDGSESNGIQTWLSGIYSRLVILFRPESNITLITRNDQGFVHAYADILRAGAPAYTTIFQHLSNVPSPCLVHCTAGKDRTGVFVALLLSLLGCSDEVVAREYALTEQGLAEKRPFLVERLLQTDALKGNVRGVENMTGARAENMIATLAMIRQDFGGVEHYLRNQCNLMDQDIRNIKNRLVTKSIL